MPAPPGLSQTLVAKVTGGTFLEPDMLEKVRYTYMHAYEFRLCYLIIQDHNALYSYMYVQYNEICTEKPATCMIASAMYVSRAQRF